MQEDLSEKTGENIYQKKSMPLDEITFNGEYGIFLEKSKDAKRDKETGEYPKIKITEPGEPLEVVYLKIRRAMFYYDETLEKFWNTNEHNHRNETVLLYQPNGVREVGVAKDLKEQYDFLSVQQILYCYLPKFNKVVRLIIKGSSLGSRFEHKEEVLKFYDYLQSFSNNEHSYQFITKLQPVEEINKMKKKYFAISFVRGNELDEEMQSEVLTMINEVHDTVTAIDAQVDMKKGTADPVDKPVELPTIDANEIPVIDDTKMPKDFKFRDEKEEIRVEDIPF